IINLQSLIVNRQSLIINLLSNINNKGKDVDFDFNFDFIPPTLKGARVRLQIFNLIFENFVD
ncbi:hypothetical protein SAMN05216556_11133, partial [Aequorivita viscosa]